MILSCKNKVALFILRCGDLSYPFFPLGLLFCGFARLPFSTHLSALKGVSQAGASPAQLVPEDSQVFATEDDSRCPPSVQPQYPLGSSRGSPWKQGREERDVGAIRATALPHPAVSCLSLTCPGEQSCLSCAGSPVWKHIPFSLQPNSFPTWRAPRGPHPALKTPSQS